MSPPYITTHTKMPSHSVDKIMIFDNSSKIGDVIHTALETVGVTTDRVSKWLGKPCNCPERREKLNQLHRWAERIIAGRIDKAITYLEQIIGH